MASRRKHEPLEVVTYAGSDLGDFRVDGERPPRSAKHVATVSWSWSPAHSARERYLICSWRRKGWTLWAMAYDDGGRRMYAQMASATPFHGYTAKFAAELLLTAAWKAGVEMWGEDLTGAHVDEEGLLNQTDIDKINREVFGTRK
jgi:hypothetical protein